eukprot:scaffold22645_cov144-Amphora_coffeaeformis.AAC.2
MKYLTSSAIEVFVDTINSVRDGSCTFLHFSFARGPANGCVLAPSNDYINAIVQKIKQIRAIETTSAICKASGTSKVREARSRIGESLPSNAKEKRPSVPFPSCATNRAV